MSTYEKHLEELEDRIRHLVLIEQAAKDVVEAWEKDEYGSDELPDNLLDLKILLEGAK